eukprot:TRINITY_DN2849_c0_g1_i2.p1 TRINITY_DN2849_c0_g1~~TRINITY_DN2849_c0_g1_i2.p1  ORF type:complete len:286 (-),score=44.03 TRINITY_DN2849_c0_g1_i2:91-948(-)
MRIVHYIFPESLRQFLHKHKPSYIPKTALGFFFVFAVLATITLCISLVVFYPESLRGYAETQCTVVAKDLEKLPKNVDEDHQDQEDIEAPELLELEEGEEGQEGGTGGEQEGGAGTGGEGDGDGGDGGEGEDGGEGGEADAGGEDTNTIPEGEEEDDFIYRPIFMANVTMVESNDTFLSEATHKRRKDGWEKRLSDALQIFETYEVGKRYVCCYDPKDLSSVIIGTDLKSVQERFNLILILSVLLFGVSFVFLGNSCASLLCKRENDCCACFGLSSAPENPFNTL